VSEGQVSDLNRPHGEVEVERLTWAQVRALFAYEPAALEAVGLARQAVAGENIAAALAASQVVTVRDDYDLLWFAPQELDQLP
jgi:hypothetical protein